MGADVLAGRDRRAGGGGGPASALRTVPERHRAERGEAAGSEPGSAQEAATIKATSCFGREVPRQRAAAGLAFASA